MKAKSQEIEEQINNERETVVNLTYYFHTMAIEKARHYMVDRKARGLREKLLNET